MPARDLMCLIVEETCAEQRRPIDRAEASAFVEAQIGAGVLGIKELIRNARYRFLSWEAVAALIEHRDL
jgi:hypothetical protein